MIFGQDRSALRRMYRDAWQKRMNGQPLTPLEAEIADVIELHPEYHAAIASEDLDRDYLPEGGESNPYLHMGLHLGLREQVATDRPAGIRAIFDRLRGRATDPHDAEHQMVECLAETLWEAQSNNTAPDEMKYLERLQNLKAR